MACSALLESAASLSALDIKGATLADVFRAFSTVDNFCGMSDSPISFKSSYLHEFSCINKNAFFIKETGTFCFIVV